MQYVEVCIRQKLTSKTVTQVSLYFPVLQISYQLGSVYMKGGKLSLLGGDIFHPASSFRLYERRDETSTETQTKPGQHSNITK